VWSSTIGAKKGRSTDFSYRIATPHKTPTHQWASLKEKFSKQPFSRLAALLTLVVFVGFVFISPYAPGSPDLLRLDVMKQVGGMRVD